MRNLNEEITRILFEAKFDAVDRIFAFEALFEEVYEDGYDQAAQDITMKIQSCIPSKTPTVADARVQGAWRDAANIALNHLGKLSRKE